MPRYSKRITTVLGLFLLAGAATAQPAKAPAPKQPAAKANDKATVAPENRKRALAVVDKFIEAIGGRERLSKKSSMHTVGTVSLMGQTGTVEVKMIPGGAFLQKMSLPAMGMESQSGSDGEHGWTFDSMNGAQMMPDTMHAQLRRESDPSSVMRYDEIYPVIEYMGERTFEGTAVDTVRVVDDSGLESLQHYSKETGLLVGGEGDQDSPQGKLRVKSVMSEYKEFDGLKIATRTTMTMGPMQMEMTLQKVEVGTVKPEDLTPPPAAQKLMEKAAAKDAEKKAKDEEKGEKKDEDGEG